MGIVVNSLRNILVRSGTVVFILLLGVLTARFLGPDGRGAYALVTVLSSIVVALLGGTGTAAGYFISNLRRPIPEVVANVATLSLVAGVAALAMTIVGYQILALVHDEPPWWLLVAGAAQPGLLLGAALTWCFLGADDHKNYSYAIVAPSLLSLMVMTPVLVLAPGSARAALLAWLAAQYLVLGWLWWRGRAAWTPLPLNTVTLSSMRALAGFSLMSGLANLVSMLNYRADLLLTSRFLGVAESGVYSIAVLLVEGLFFISQAVGVAIWARVGGADQREAAVLTARSIRITLLLMVAAGIVLYGASGIAIPLLFGRDFAGAVTPFRWLLPGVAAWGAANLFAAYYTNQLGRPRVPLTVAGISLVINVLLCLVLIPRAGLAGAAIASSAGYLVAIVVEMWLFRRDAGATWRTLLLVNRADLREALSMARVALGRGRDQSDAPL